MKADEAAQATARVIDEIASERARQITKEGYALDHDDEHDDGSLALAAACYASPVLLYREDVRANSRQYNDPWPWAERFDKRPGHGNQVVANKHAKPGLRRNLLIKAAALIVAEIERLDRATRRAVPVA